MYSKHTLNVVGSCRRGVTGAVGGVVHGLYYTLSDRMSQVVGLGTGEDNL